MSVDQQTIKNNPLKDDFTFEIKNTSDWSVI